MTHSRNICPEGWEAAQLLAYIEGNLEPDAQRDLALHLQECRVCSLELESLQRLDCLLKAHPESFHPDDEELYHFAFEHADPGGHIASHLESCSECGESLRAFREMIDLRTAGPGRSKMPQALERAVERIYGTGLTPPKRNLIGAVADFLRKTFSVPILALGTAAAVLILGVLIIPMWRALKEVPAPQAVPPAEKIAETQGRKPAQRSNVQGRISTQESQYNGQPTKVYPKAEGFQAPPLPRPATPAPVSKQAAPESNLSLEAAPQKPVRGLMEKRKKAIQGFEAEPERERPVAGAKPARDSELKEEEGRPASRELPRQLAPPPAAMKSDTRIPVRVLITDVKGRPVPWLSFAPDLATENRYVFVGPATLKDELSKRKRAAESSAPALEARQGYVITVRVTESGGTYEIEAKLFSGGVEADGTPSKTVVARNLNKQDVPGRVTFLVGLLLGH
jgi:anti-sigma factor RsiW